MSDKSRRIVTLIVVGIAIYVGFHALGNDSATTTAATTPPAAAVDTTSIDPAPPPPAPVRVLDVTGNGIKNTVTFTVGDVWTVAYAYNCAAVGGEGNFIIDVSGDGAADGEAAANELNAQGQSSSQEYGAGTYHLEINSECSWHVVVTS